MRSRTRDECRGNWRLETEFDIFTKFCTKSKDCRNMLEDPNDRIVEANFNKIFFAVGSAVAALETESKDEVVKTENGVPVGKYDQYTVSSYVDKHTGEILVIGSKEKVDSTDIESQTAVPLEFQILVSKKEILYDFPHWECSLDKPLVVPGKLSSAAIANLEATIKYCNEP